MSQARGLPQQVKAYSNLKRMVDRYRNIEVLGFDDRAASEFQRLRSLKIRIGTMDLKIAAIALSHNATLLTRNLVDFQQVPGLRAEDWAA